MFIATLQVEVGEAGLREVVESARTGELSDIAFVVLRNLALAAKIALREHDQRVVALRPKPTIREMRRAA